MEYWAWDTLNRSRGRRVPFCQTGAALVGESHDSPVGAHDPAEVDETQEEGSAEPSAEMGPLLAPVNAVTDERPAIRRVDVDPQVHESPAASGGENEALRSTGRPRAPDHCWSYRPSQPGTRGSRPARPRRQRRDVRPGGRSTCGPNGVKAHPTLSPSTPCLVVDGSSPVRSTVTCLRRIGKDDFGLLTAELASARVWPVPVAWTLC